MDKSNDMKRPRSTSSDPNSDREYRHDGIRIGLLIVSKAGISTTSDALPPDPVKVNHFPDKIGLDPTVGYCSFWRLRVRVNNNLIRDRFRVLFAYFLLKSLLRTRHSLVSVVIVTQSILIFFLGSTFPILICTNGYVVDAALSKHLRMIYGFIKTSFLLSLIERNAEILQLRKSMIMWSVNSSSSWSREYDSCLIIVFNKPAHIELSSGFYSNIETVVLHSKVEFAYFALQPNIRLDIIRQ